MQIPTSFQLGGFTWKVRQMKRLPGKYGDCDLAKREIRILQKLDDEMKGQVFCHELGHAILFAMGVDQSDHNEQNVDAYAMFLHQFMTSAKYDRTD